MAGGDSEAFGMYILEPCRPEDANAVARVAEAALGAELPAAFFLQSATNDPDLFLVAREEFSGRIVGFVMAAGREPKEARVTMFGVLPEAQGTGVGRRLLRRLQSTLQHRDVRTLGLEVRADNPRAVDFYLRQGFAVEGVLEAVYEDGADGLAMSKPLA